MNQADVLSTLEILALHFSPLRAPPCPQAEATNPKAREE
jgi:hypothetical protein